MILEISETTKRLLIAESKRLNLDHNVLANRVLYLMLEKHKDNSQNSVGNLSDDEILNFQEDLTIFSPILKLDSDV
jgi:hypothetical protein